MKIEMDIYQIYTQKLCRYYRVIYMWIHHINLYIFMWCLFRILLTS